VSTGYSIPADFQVRVDDLQIHGRGFSRPECVLALSSGEVLASHGSGGYSVRTPDGALRHVIGRGEPGRQYVPNGIALAPDGRVLFADLGAEQGGIFAVEPDGRIVPVVAEIEGKPMPPSNFVTVDEAEVLWFTVSTRLHPRSRAWTPTVADGFIAVSDHRGTRIVADGLAYTNEIAFSPDGQWVYTNETYGQCVSRFRLLPGPRLGPRELVAQLGGADLPDGICFDVEGGAWISCIASNRLLLLRPDGTVQTVLADTDEEHARHVANGIRSATLAHATMQTAGRSRLGNISSLAFGGPDRRTAYLGCLLDDRLRGFRTPVQGAELPHWRRRLRSA
jgi:sugar lactone lactonase YvrE